MIKPGRYKHYKGGIYRVLFTAVNTETETVVVIYAHETYGTYYARPFDEFIADVDGAPRFKFLDE